MSGYGTEWLNLVNREEWQDDAICRQVDQGDIFFPDKGDSVEPAKKVCWHACPVRLDCLAFAFTHNEKFGVWGGWSERERYRASKGQDVTPKVPKVVEFTQSRCEWCGSLFRGDTVYCCKGCSSSASRARRRAARAS